LTTLGSAAVLRALASSDSEIRNTNSPTAQ
jgi:hypothetical protein